MMTKIWNYLGEFSNGLNMHVVKFCDDLLKGGVLIKLRRNRRLLQHPTQSCTLLYTSITVKKR